MFLPVPPGIELPKVSPAAMQPAARPPQVANAPDPIIPHRRNPERDVRLLPAFSVDDIFAAKKRALYADEKAKLLGRAAPAQRWFEDPIALGTLLLLCPPIGLAALWSSKRYSTDARWALTVMTALVLCLVAAVTIAFVALAR
jgi:hypothetical protein